VRNLAGPRLDVEDMVHEIFLVVQRRLPQFRGEARVTTWLYRITRNVVATASRKARVRRFLMRLRRADVHDSLAPAAASLPGSGMERQQDTRALHRVLGALPERYRAILVMFELEAMSGDEIAAVTGLRPQAVRVVLHRARKAFLKELARQGDD